jgi:DNA-directed RNA polymerase specialized sigma24 family protein
MTQLAAADPAAASLVQLRYFGGLSVPQAAEALGISPRTAHRLWIYARAWLHDKVQGTGPEDNAPA